MSYDKIKSHKKLRLPPLCRRYIFNKPQSGGSNLPGNLLRVIKLTFHSSDLNIQITFTMFSAFCYQWLKDITAISFIGCLPQILLGPFLNILSHMNLNDFSVNCDKIEVVCMWNLFLMDILQCEKQKQKKQQKRANCPLKFSLNLFVQIFLHFHRHQF